jgi:hypothetical protein
LSPVASTTTTTVRFRGFVETSSPGAMAGYACVAATAAQVAAHHLATSALSHYEQAFILSNLGDAAFDQQVCRPSTWRVIGGCMSRPIER